MRGIFRYFYRQVIPNRLLSAVDLFKNLRMEKVGKLKEKRVLVLSPHPDDDILGCGGTLRIYHQMGADITAVYMTDGRKGGSGRYDEDELVLIRKDEARKAAAILGIDRLIFLNSRDTEISCTHKTVKELSDILEDIKPDVIFLPFLLDNHRDHLATNAIFVEASKNLYKEIMCCGYEVWTPITTANCIVDITETISIKMAALGEHKSQMTEINLVDAAVGLSKYRGAIHNLRDSNAEVFVKCTVSEYRRLWEVIQ